MSMKSLDIMSYSNSRLEDINDLLNTLSSLSSNRCPRHEKRRTTSHFKFKISRRKIDHEKEKKITEKKIKVGRGLRKTSSRSIRLSTHLYNAKRMKMSSLWGYIIPKRHTGRGLRALKSILRDHCAIVDQSFYRPINIRGTRSNIMLLLEKFLVLYSSYFFSCHNWKNEPDMIYMSSLGAWKWTSQE